MLLVLSVELVAARCLALESVAGVLHSLIDVALNAEMPLDLRSFFAWLVRFTPPERIEQVVGVLGNAICRPLFH